jgi:hypothetical protein
VRAPRRTPPGPAADPLAVVLAERDRAREELARLRGTPTFRLLSRAHRRLGGGR